VYRAGIEGDKHTCMIVKMIVAYIRQARQPDLMLIGCVPTAHNVADITEDQHEHSVLGIRHLSLTFHALIRRQY
jgi:hypothetical protein